MSLVNPKPIKLNPRKEKKVQSVEHVKEYMKNYHCQFRENNSELVRLKERTKYHKQKHHLDDKFCEQYGHYSGDVYKIKSEFQKVVYSAPELFPHIIKLLQEQCEINE